MAYKPGTIVYPPPPVDKFNFFIKMLFPNFNFY